MSSPAARLTALSLGFRQRYLSYDELTEQCRAWAREFPDLVRLESLGQTPEGRDVWLLTLGPDPDRARPGAWVDGNIHATELCGSSAALAIAEDVIALHLDPEREVFGLPRHVRDTLRDVLFHVLPRMSPDGAEAVLATGRWVRSVPRDERAERQAPRWIARDLDGDGLSLLLRIEHPAGEYVESRHIPGVMLPRRLEDEGPFYKLFPEGVIEPWDGFTIPERFSLSDNFPDLNRNFPWSWMPEPTQVGAGLFPGSEPESRAVLEAVADLPTLFAWTSFHTFGGVFIRPLGSEPDEKMDPSDRALFAQIGEWAETLTGYPMVSGFREFTYVPDHPLHGDASDFAYHARGCIAYVVELWDLFRRIGMQRPERFCDHYTHATRSDHLALARWDREHNAGRVYRSWKPVTHPQLGNAEVGGYDPRVGVWNPPLDRIDEICSAQSATFLRVAALAPRVVLGVRALTLGSGLARLDVDVENLGYLPTYILSSAKGLPHSEELHVELVTSGDVTVEGAARRCIGHLEGWGRGVQSAGTSLHAPRSRGNSNAVRSTFTVRGTGSVIARVSSARIGCVEKTVTLDGTLT
jgi:hypothetical protein